MAKRTVLAEVEGVEGSCGVNNYCGFEPGTNSDRDWAISLSEISRESSGYGFANFVDNAVCREAYNILAKRFKIVYQSEVRKNPRSDRKGFFCIYDERVPGDINGQ